MKTSKRKQAKKTTHTKPRTTTAIPPTDPEIARLIRTIDATGAVVAPSSHREERPAYGTVIFIAECTVEMRSGLFTAYVFQDLIHKGYVIALAHGDIKRAKLLYTRIHSSCVTSETLRGCDCDCVQQLEGALKRISEEGNGILFYLIQEGRGVGYVAKSRDRMLVQASRDTISTFKAYEAMGLKKDYRNYSSIAAICHLLGISSPFVLLTNNPDKVSALKALGLNIVKTDTIEYDPGPHNLAYLASKAESGHLLKKTKPISLTACLPPEPVIPFTPYALEDASRFIYVASYFLPMKPIDGEVLLTDEQYREIFAKRSVKDYLKSPSPFLLGESILSNSRRIVRIDRKRLRSYRTAHPNDPASSLLTTPYWFRIHAYYDIVSGQDFIVLVHGTPQRDLAPVVRLHSESIFNRFPLENVENRDKFKSSVRHIVKNGYGMILLLYNDGRGAGFGAYATDMMYHERDDTASTEDSYRIMGLDFDTRDYNAAATLLKHHVKESPIQMIMTSPDNLVKKADTIKAFESHNIQVERWIFLDE